jgi:hypothetical protein
MKWHFFHNVRQKNGVWWKEKQCLDIESNKTINEQSPTIVHNEENYVWATGKFIWTNNDK